MKSLVNILLALALITLVLSLIAKVQLGMVTGKAGMIAGVGPAGYLQATMVILLFGANLALLELLRKK